jgi:hypothetical protein
MSSIIFQTEPDLAIVATDTLAVSLDDRSLAYFTSKAQIIPHIRTIVAGTGIANFCSQWFFQVMNEMVVDDVDHLNYHSPSALVELWQLNKEEFSVENGLTTTIYHFGFSKKDECIHSYAYRSKNGFQSEPMSYGLRYKPKFDLTWVVQLPNDIKRMMDCQRATQLLVPEQERIFIGGEIQLFVLDKNGFFVRTIDKFDDYDSNRKAIYNNFDK